MRELHDLDSEVVVVDVGAETGTICSTSSRSGRFGCW